jgi:hypothetical protein
VFCVDEAVSFTPISSWLSAVFPTTISSGYLTNWRIKLSQEFVAGGLSPVCGDPDTISTSPVAAGEVLINRWLVI